MYYINYNCLRKQLALVCIIQVSNRLIVTLMSAHHGTESSSCVLYQPRRRDKHPADSIEPHQAYKHSSRLPGIFVWRRRPFAYKRGVGDVTTVSGLSCGESIYLWLTLEQEGNGIAFCTFHKYETSITTERPLSC